MVLIPVAYSGTMEKDRSSPSPSKQKEASTTSATKRQRKEKKAAKRGKKEKKAAERTAKKSKRSEEKDDETTGNDVQLPGKKTKKCKRKKDRDSEMIGRDGQSLEKKAKKSKRKKDKDNETTGNGRQPPEKEKSTRHHAFVTNSLDHCETPYAAYQNIKPFLEALATNLGIHPPSKLRIWDPYYCDGMVKRNLSELGFTNVINENADFYDLIKRGDLPQYDIVVTNPPYSDTHIARLLEFVLTSRDTRPFCLLMPNWVARKPEYKATFGSKLELFHLSPVNPYTYAMPSWAEKPEHVAQDGLTTPYLSSWFISCGNAERTTKLGEHMDLIAKRQWPPAWVVAKTIKGLKWKIQKISKNSPKR